MTVKLAASIAPSPSASLQSREFDAKAMSAAPVESVSWADDTALRFGVAEGDVDSNVTLQ